MTATRKHVLTYLESKKEALQLGDNYCFSTIDLVACGYDNFGAGVKLKTVMVMVYKQNNEVVVVHIPESVEPYEHQAYDGLDIEMSDIHLENISIESK